MAPIRRYLRITKYSVLEVRIYLDVPSQQQWLLNPRDDVLPRIFQAIRPYVLPKLREENERAKGKSKRPKGVKDTVTQDDFEVAIFLTEVSTRHSLLTKQRQFQDKESRIKSNSSKLTGWLEKETNEEPVTIREESNDDADPALGEYSKDDSTTTSNHDHGGKGKAVVIEDDISDDEGFQTQRAPAGKRDKKAGTLDADGEAEGEDDKKKLSMNTAYDGFSIYGRILCLVVKRKGVKARPAGVADGGGQMMLENWVSTQAAQELSVDE